MTMVNQEIGTNPEADLIEALGGEELEQPTESAELEEDATEADAEAEGQDEDAELEAADEDSDEESEADADEGTKRYTVAIDGQEQKVSLKELKEGFMKDGDYRRKTADLADKRKHYESVIPQYEAGLNTLGQELEVVLAFLESQVDVDDKALDRMAEENPAEFVRVKRELEKKGSAIGAVQHKLAQVRQAQQANSDRTLKEWREGEQAKLHEAAPEFRDPTVVKRLHEYLTKDYGLTAEEIASVGDHRFTRIAEKARRYDAIKAKAALKDKQVQKAPKVQMGGQSGMATADAKQAQRALTKVMNSGRVEDLANLL